MKVGILGCGHVSDQYLEGIPRSELLEIVACADIDLARAEAKAAQHGVPKSCAPEQLIQDREVDLIVNLTPPGAHADASLAAIAAGKHVWSEKPLASSLDAAREVLDAADEAGLLIGCAPDTFLGGSIQTAIKLIDDGWVGRPVSGVAFVSEHGYEHFHPAVHSFYEPGGGPVLDLGPYYVTALVAMLGPVARVTSFARATFPERVAQVGPRRGERIPVQVPTHVTGALEFASGALVTVLMSWDIWATNLPYLEVYGTAGSVSVANPDEFAGLPRLRRAGSEELELPPPPPGTVPWFEIPLVQPGDVGRGIGIADMAEAIRDGRPHRASGVVAYHVLEVLLGLERSAREGGHVAIESRSSRPTPLTEPLVPLNDLGRK
jgi:predicted dehydrogenase